MDASVKTFDLTKKYGPVTAVDNLNVAVRKGEFFGLLGPNGAGKTTTIRMLTGLTKPTSGKAVVAGYDVTQDGVEAKKRLGVVPEVSNLYVELTAWENLMFMAELHRVPKVDRDKKVRRLLQLFGLYERRKDSVEGFSKGMKRRLTIAAALVHDPEILFLDEPTIGLDVQGSRMIRELLRRFHREGKTIFLTTHYIEEADALCQRVAIINQGRVIALDSPEKLKAGARSKPAIEVAFDRTSPRVVEGLRRLSCVVNLTAHGDKLRLYVKDTSDATLSIADYARANELRVVSFGIVKPSLEDVFVELTGLTSVEVERMEHLKPKRGGGRGG